MVFWFSRLIDFGVDSQLRKDASGQLVFLPFGPRKKAYFVDSKSDEEKIRAFVKMYRSASTLISWMWIGIYSFGWTAYVGASAVPLRTRVTDLVVSGLVYMLLPIAFLLILWGVYKQTIPNLTSSLREAGADVAGQLTDAGSGRRRVILVCLGACVILMGLLLVAVQHRLHKPCPAQGRVCQQENYLADQSRPRS